LHAVAQLGELVCIYRRRLCVCFCWPSVTAEGAYQQGPTQPPQPSPTSGDFPVVATHLQRLLARPVAIVYPAAPCRRPGCSAVLALHPHSAETL
jgi:hypothetical protein